MFVPLGGGSSLRTGKGKELSCVLSKTNKKTVRGGQDRLAAMGDQSMGSGISGDISARLLHHVVRILNENNTTSPMMNGYGTNSSAKFNPSMAIIIIVLISAFLFMGFFSIYVRRCTRSDDNANQNSSQQAARNGGANANRPTQGLEKEVVEALPLIGYPLVKGLEGGKDLTECAVCLSDFDEDEDVRVLPKCGHVFHQDCIDMWFHSHSTCPLCRASLVPAEGKEGVEGESHTTEDLQNWVSSRGTGPNGETFTIHDGPPVPPNGSILELLSRDGADRILAESLRRDGPLDAGLARREGEDENAERAAGIRALNRTLSRNSSSIRRASRGLEAGDRIGAAATGSARFNSSSVVINVDGNGAGRDNRKPRSMGSSHSFNMTLLRSSSAGSSGRYLRQYFGVQDETDGFRSKLLGSEHKLPVANTRIRRERSASELLNEEAPMWEDVDLNADTGAGVNATRTPASSTPTVPGGLPFERWTSRGRKFFSAELPGPAAKRMDSSGEASGPFHIFQKEREPQVEERTKSERWNFGQSFRRTFSLKRTTSNTSDVESSSQQGGSSNKSFYSQPGSSAASKPKKFSPWAGAMKIRRTTSAGGDGLASPHSPSAMAFPESLPVESFPLSLSVDSFPESHPVPSEQQQQHQHQHESPPKEDPITILTQP